MCGFFTSTNKIIASTRIWRWEWPEGVACLKCAHPWTSTVFPILPPLSSLASFQCTLLYQLLGLWTLSVQRSSIRLEERTRLFPTLSTFTLPMPTHPLHSPISHPIPTPPHSHPIPTPTPSHSHPIPTLSSFSSPHTGDWRRSLCHNAGNFGQVQLWLLCTWW